MDAQRVEVLHRHHREAVVVLVADHLELDLLPPFQALLHQDLAGEGEGALAELDELLLVVADARSLSPQGVGGADHDGEPDLMCRPEGIVQALHRVGHRCLDLNLVELLHKQIPVLGDHDRLHGGAQHPHPMLVEHTALVELGTAVEGGLTAKGEQDAVGLLLRDHPLHEVRGDGQEVNLVGHPLRGLYGCDVGVDQDGLDPLLTHGFQRLRAGVIELTRLSDLQGSRAQ